MAIETNYKSFKHNTFKFKSNDLKENRGIVYDYQDALQTVLNTDELKSKIEERLQTSANERNSSKIIIKNKNYLRKLKDDYNSLITEIIMSNQISVRGYKDILKLALDFTEDIVGYSVLAPLMNDETVTDIFCLENGQKIFYESSNFEKPQLFDKQFVSEKSFKNFIERILREAGKSPLDNGEHKLLDFSLYEDRYNAVSPAISPKGYSLTIRKHKEEHITLEQLIKSNTFDEKSAKLLGLLIQGESNLMIAGGTGSGKTTALRALIDYYVPQLNKRILSCEDERELFLSNENTLELVTSKGVDEKSDISLRDVITLALRQKPKYIIVGEVRSVEAETAVEAMSTGHSVLFSIHAGTPIEAVNRIITKYLMQMPSLGTDVVERIIGSAVDYIYIQADIPGIGRRMVGLTEVSYDYEQKRVSLKPIIKYNFKTNSFDFVGTLSEDKIQKLLIKGISHEKLIPFI